MCLTRLPCGVRDVDLAEIRTSCRCEGLLVVELKAGGLRFAYESSSLLRIVEVPRKLIAQLLENSAVASGAEHAGFRVQLDSCQQATGNVLRHPFPEVSVRLVSGGKDGSIGWQLAALKRQGPRPSNVDQPHAVGHQAILSVTCRAHSSAPLPVDGFAMALDRRAAACPNGTFFPLGTTNFNCYVHPSAGTGTAIAVISALLGILVVLSAILGAPPCADPSSPWLQ